MAEKFAPALSRKSVWGPDPDKDLEGQHHTTAKYSRWMYPQVDVAQQLWYDDRSHSRQE
jgi:hypothetical protein